MAKITEGYMPFKGYQTYYRIVGEEYKNNGKAPLICLHGGPGSTHNYYEVLDNVADDDQSGRKTGRPINRRRYIHGSMFRGRNGSPIVSETDHIPSHAGAKEEYQHGDRRLSSRSFLPDLIIRETQV